MGEWMPIESAPRDGTLVDLWIVGADDMVDFYSPTARKVRGKPLRHGRACNFRWEHRYPPQPNWYPAGGLGYPLSPEVTPTHWRPLPASPDAAPPAPPPATELVEALERIGKLQLLPFNAGGTHDFSEAACRVLYDEVKRLREIARSALAKFKEQSHG